MKKKTNKKLLGFAGLFIVIGFLLTGCSSFCSALDSASYRYAYDPINTSFFDSEENATDYVYNQIKKQVNNDEIFIDSSRETVLTLENVNTLEVSDLEGSSNFTNVKLIQDVHESLFTSIKLNQTDELYYLTSGTVTVYTAQFNEETNETLSISHNISFSKNDFVKSINTSASTNYLSLPSDFYWNYLDNKVIDEMYLKANADGYLADIEEDYDTTYELFYGYSNDALNDYRNNPTTEKEEILLEGGEYTLDNGNKETVLGRNKSLFTLYGRYKYISDDTSNALNMADGNYWSKINTWNNEILEEVKINDTTSMVNGFNMSSDYFSLYQQNMNSRVSTINSCISIDEGFYGHISDDPLNETVQITNKSNWGDAWSHGWLEGLLVFPIGYMTEYFSHAFGMNGVGQILSVLLVTFIVRGLFMLLSFRSTLSQQKMQYLQPEIAKLQEKYPNSNTNEYEKQRLAQAQMNLYKRYKVHPFSSLIVLIFQFPIFIAVWNGLSGSASLSVDAVLGLRLSDTISNVLFTWSNWPGAECWTALILFLLMSTAQIISMQLPQWLSKRRNKDVTKMYKNPAANSQQKQMKIVQWVMTIFIIIMGFTLPAAMGVYWLAGALFSMIQTTIMHFIMIKHKGMLKELNIKTHDATDKKESLFTKLFKKSNKDEKTESTSNNTLNNDIIDSNEITQNNEVRKSKKGFNRKKKKSNNHK